MVDLSVSKFTGHEWMPPQPTSFPFLSFFFLPVYSELRLQMYSGGEIRTFEVAVVHGEVGFMLQAWVCS